jgi:hypothetical protein
MTMIGVVALDEIEQRSDSLEIAAFCGEECRGSVIASFHETFDRYYFYLMVYGNEGNEISFRCYDHKNDYELYMISETSINFQTNVMTGDVLEPFVFSFKSYQYNVSVDVLPEIGGTISGGGIYKHGDEVSVVANPNDGYIFLNWTENDSVVSEDTDYKFVIISDRNIIANFEKIEEPEEPGDDPDEPTESVEEYVVRRDGEIVATQTETSFSENVIDGIVTYTVVAKNGNHYSAPDFIVVNSNVESGENIVKIEDNKVSLYPNPTSGMLYIKLDNAFDAVVYNYQGQVVMREYNNDGQIDLSHLSTGIYFVEIIDGQNVMIEKVIVK